MVYHENWDFPENSQSMPMLGLYISVWPQRSWMLDAKAITSLDGPPVFPTPAETQRPRPQCHVSLTQYYFSNPHLSQ